MSAKLERTVNVAILVTCVAVVATLGSRAWDSLHRESRNQSFREGEVFTLLDREGLQRAEHTLVMIVRKDCRFCTASMPFYQRLAERESRGYAPRKNQLVVVTPDDRTTAEDYLASHHLTVATTVSVPRQRASELKIVGTPTLVLVDKAGRIEKVWIGQLDSAGEQDVESALAHS